MLSLLLIILLVNLSFSDEWQFPENFKFGIATSAYQIEGAWNEDGKGPNIWDTLTQNYSDRIKDGGNGNIACDSYHKWQDDINLVKDLNMDFYRFSLSWTRLLPNGVTTNLNQAGVNYYNNIINELLKNGIQPVVTIYHWDLPEIFSSLGGWTNPIVIGHYVNFARTCFKLFGDRVKIWITFNEPNLICNAFKGLVGHVTNHFPLGITEYLCIQNLLKAHAEAYHVYDKEFRFKQKGRISLTMDITWFEPNATQDESVAEQNRQFQFGIFANPIFKFDFPAIVIQRIAERSKLEGFTKSRLPKFSLEEKLRIKGTGDFIGLNHYITIYAQRAQEADISQPNIDLDAGGYKFPDPKWKGCAAPWIKVVPWGLRKALNWIKSTYNNPEILITESGYADDGSSLEDVGRIEYYQLYLNATLAAILEDKVNVTSYIAWSLMDNFEWRDGYTLNFGLYNVNFTDPSRPRIPKKSVEFFKQLTRTRKLE